MREIKFRAWDKKEGGWSSLAVAQALLTGSNSSIEIHSDRHIFMQYTGLKDKNGKEIYEGDILSMNGHTEGRVEFLTGSYWFAGKPLWEYYDLTEVIGNIYENPELVK